VEFSNIFEEQEIDLGEGLDLYGEHESKPEEMQLETRTSLDSFLESLEIQIKTNRNLFGGVNVSSIDEVEGDKEYSPTITYTGIRNYLESLSVD